MEEVMVVGMGDKIFPPLSMRITTASLELQSNTGFEHLYLPLVWGHLAHQKQLAALGFLSSDEVFRNGVVNAGLLDQVGVHTMFATTNQRFPALCLAVGTVLHWPIWWQCFSGDHLCG